MFRNFSLRCSNTMTPLVGDTFIKNIQHPPCITCKYFQLYIPKELYQTKKDGLQFSKCKKYGYKDIISGEILYETVGKSRFDKDMCRIEGIYHREARSA